MEISIRNSILSILCDYLVCLIILFPEYSAPVPCPSIETCFNLTLDVKRDDTNSEIYFIHSKIQIFIS